MRYMYRQSIKKILCQPWVKQCSQHYLGFIMGPGPPTPPLPSTAHNTGHASTFRNDISVHIHNFSLHPGSHGLQNESHAEIADFPVSLSSSCLCHAKSVIQALLYSFIFCRLILITAGGLMVFSAISRFCFPLNFEANNDTRRRFNRSWMWQKWLDAS